MTEGTDMNQIEKVARAIIGPHEPVPASSRYTLDELREVRWRQITSDERSMALREAKAAIAAMQPAPQWQGIETAPRDGTKAILYFPQYATDFDGVDYSYRLAIYRKNSTFPLGTWCDQGTNHDSFEGPDMTGCDKASHWMPIPTPPAGGSDAE